MKGYLTVWDVPIELRQSSETPRLTGFETAVEEEYGMFNILRAIVARACREALRRVAPVAKGKSVV